MVAVARGVVGCRGQSRGRGGCGRAGGGGSWRRRSVRHASREATFARRPGSCGAQPSGSLAHRGRLPIDRRRSGAAPRLCSGGVAEASGVDNARARADDAREARGRQQQRQRHCHRDRPAPAPPPQDVPHAHPDRRHCRHATRMRAGGCAVRAVLNAFARVRSAPRICSGLGAAVGAGCGVWVPAERAHRHTSTT